MRLRDLMRLPKPEVIEQIAQRLTPPQMQRLYESQRVRLIGLFEIRAVQWFVIQFKEGRRWTEITVQDGGDGLRLHVGPSRYWNCWVDGTGEVPRLCSRLKSWNVIGYYRKHRGAPWEQVLRRKT
jgi:hypothetical protein